MEFRLLGPIEVRSDGCPLELGTPQQRSVLAALAVDAGRPVMVHTLISRIWDVAPPVGARPALYAHIARIRQVLGGDGAREPVRLARRAGGYQLEIDPDRVDVAQFRRLTATARDPRHSDAERSDLLQQALRLWHGPPLADLPGEWAARMRDSWQNQRMDTVVGWAQAQLRLGHADDVIDLVRDLVADHPRTESLTGVLMRAYAAAGRRTDALDCYTATRARLVHELGVEPGPGLRELHAAVLRGELGRGDRTGPPAPPARTGPAQLPADVSDFVGRQQELSELDSLLAGGDAQQIAVLSGPAGVGKTAAALRWAHRSRGQFPDGQLYLDLRGYDPDRPVTAAAALAGLLAGVGVSTSDIPADLDARAASYRTQISGRRMLVLLDNAASADQVRTLLPGTTSCATLVTSRDALPGLVARHGARRLDLDLLPLTDAVLLLQVLVGGRVAAEPGAAGTLARQCARLPLALRIAAELAISQPGRPLGQLVADLGDPYRRLDLLDAGGDRRTGLRAVFGWSYRGLAKPAARAFRLLGAHPAVEFDIPTAAALTGIPPEAARTLLDTLARAHLVEPVRPRADPPRYRMHDLLKAYAQQLA